MSDVTYPIYHERYGWGWPPDDYTGRPGALPKPRLYQLGGKWWCIGPKPQTGLFADGRGASPYAAYMAWGRKETGVCSLPWVSCEPRAQGIRSASGRDLSIFGRAASPDACSALMMLDPGDAMLAITTSVVQDLLRKGKS